MVFNPAGRYAVAQVASMQEAGTRIVAGIQLGRGGETVAGFALLDSLAAVAETPDAAIIYTPPEGVLAAVRACTARGVPSIVVAAEYVPVHDAIGCARAAREAECWLVGPNTLGLCVPGEGLLGSIAPSFCTPGRLAVLCRSGTLTLAMARLLTMAGIGQRAVMHIGGDTVAGRNPHEYLAALAEDERTAAVLYCGEIGGDKEYALAEAVSTFPKPVVAMLVGRHAPREKRMGHAGAMVEAERESAAAKLTALSAAGAQVAQDPEDVIAILKELGL